MRNPMENRPRRLPAMAMYFAFALLLLFAQPLALSGCAVKIGDSGSQAPTVPTAQASGQTRTVKLQVVSHQGSVLALVPVYIQDQGPFAFALDTGASSSLVDQDLAKKLGLKTGGTVGNITGVTGATQATQVQIDQWRAGDVPLPSTSGVTVDLPDPNSGSGLQGLLGSDVLSEFGAITVDYENQVLILRSRKQG